MQISHHLALHSVAGEQQRRRARLPAFAVAGLLAAAFCTAEPAAAAERESAPPPRSYGAVLGASYVLAPLLAFGVGGLLSEVEASDELAVLVAAPMFLLPAAVHVYQGDAGAKARAGLSLASMAGMTFGGTIAGGIGGYLENKISCDPEIESECADRGIGAVIIGAVIGTGIGYIGSGVVDVIFRSETEPEDAPAVSTQLWVAPVNGARSAARPLGERSARPGSALGAADGVLMGMTVRW